MMKKNDQLVARQWDIFQSEMRKHRAYCNRAAMLEDFYLACGGQWSQEERDFLENTVGRACVEFNEIGDAVDTAIGYQINNRASISFVPRGGEADEEKATVLHKVVKQILDSQAFRWKETSVWSDALIQQRGYFDVRLGFENNANGEVVIEVLDPLDVMPDSKANSYETKGWRGVIVARLLTDDEIGSRYGDKAQGQAKKDNESIDLFGTEDENGIERNRFGDNEIMSDDDHGEQRRRVIDRQYWVSAPNTPCLIFPDGSIKTVDRIPPNKLQSMISAGAKQVELTRRRIRWTVTTQSKLLHDDWSPFEHFTVVPMFGKFRRGRTTGMVDSAIDPQRLLNKAISGALHIVNSSANGGWLTEEDSLTNMSNDDLNEWGSKTGINIEYRKGSTKPEKIKPNDLPQAASELMDIASKKIKSTTGMTDSARGEMGKNNQSGVAIKQLQFAAQLSLAMPLDNLARTRCLLAKQILSIVQRFYTDEQVFRITEELPTGKRKTVELFVNQAQPDGSILNDLTVGDYDVVVDSIPDPVSYQGEQLASLVDMFAKGILPAELGYLLIKHSQLHDKEQIIEALQSAQKNKKPDPSEEAKIMLMNAQAALARATEVTKNIESLFSAAQTAQIVAQIPAAAPLADTIARSSGFVDKDAAPLFPSSGQIPPDIPPPPENTNPATPTNPARGMTAGIEKGVVQ